MAATSESFNVALLPGQQQAPAQQQMGSRPPAAMREVEVQSVPCLAKLSAIGPCTWPTMCYCVNPNEEVAVITYGTLTRMRAEPGCYCDWPNVRRSISVKMLTVNLPDSKVADANGAPVVVSAILNYRVCDAKRAMFAVEDCNRFVLTNATAILKQVVGTHTYEELKTHAKEVNQAMADQVRPEVAIAGIHVESMQMNELNYAPEIAGAMLKKQQAGALVEARELIVEGACKIAQDAISRLEASGKLELSQSDKVKIVTNLLTVTCSETDATPTVNVS